MGAMKLKPALYKSAAGITLYEVDSLRAKNMPDELDDIIIAKMQQIDPVNFAVAYLMNDGNFLTGLAARACTALKIREKTNKNDGYMVEMIQKVGGGKKGWAWCMYEMMACIGIAETLTGVASRVPYSGGVMDVKNRCPKDLIVKFKDSLFGDLWLKSYGDGTGHVGCFDRWYEEGSIGILNEGNTTSGKAGDKVIREGGGSYETERRLDSSWVACIRPFPLVESKTFPSLPPSRPADITYPRFGEISDRVATMQRALNRYGASLKVDGDFGVLTREALSKFQKANGLPGTGQPGPQTMDLLNGAHSLPPDVAGSPSNPNWEALWQTCVLDAGRVAEIKKICARIELNRSTYEKIAKLADTQWWVVGLTHYRESSALTLDVYLHNGQKLGKTTTIVPKGIFFAKDQFIEASVDAMKAMRRRSRSTTAPR